MNPIKLLEDLKPVRIFTLEEYIKATSSTVDESITNTTILMDYVNNKHNILQLDSFRFMKPLTGFEPFIKKICNDDFT